MDNGTIWDGSIISPTPSLLDQVIGRNLLHPAGHEVGHTEDQ